MNIEKYLNQFVEGYLFNDLENMSTLEQDKNVKGGGAGYPMLFAALAGIELLGGLISEPEFKTNKEFGRQYFNKYWNECLSKQNTNYRGLGDLFYKRVRNGLAHSFLSKQGVLVPKFNNPTFFKFDADRKELTVNCIYFYQDLKKSYYKSIKPILEGEKSFLTTKDKMQGQLNEMLRLYEVEANNMFGDLKHITPRLHEVVDERLMFQPMSYIQTRSPIKVYLSDDAGLISGKTSGASGINSSMKFTPMEGSRLETPEASVTRIESEQMVDKRSEGTTLNDKDHQ